MIVSNYENYRAVNICSKKLFFDKSSFFEILKKQQVYIQVYSQVYIEYFLGWVEEKNRGGSGIRSRNVAPAKMDTTILTIGPWAIRKNNKTCSGNSLLLSFIKFSERV